MPKAVFWDRTAMFVLNKLLSHSNLRYKQSLKKQQEQQEEDVLKPKIETDQDIGMKL